MEDGNALPVNYSVTFGGNPIVAATCSVNTTTAFKIGCNANSIATVYATDSNGNINIFAFTQSPPNDYHCQLNK